MHAGPALLREWTRRGLRPRGPRQLPFDLSPAQLRDRLLGALDLGDRVLRLVNASIDTWNLYPQGDAVVEVTDSLLGEILSF